MQSLRLRPRLSCPHGHHLTKFPQTSAVQSIVIRCLDQLAPSLHSYCPYNRDDTDSEWFKLFVKYSARINVGILKLTLCTSTTTTTKTIYKSAIGCIKTRIRALITFALSKQLLYFCVKLSMCFDLCSTTLIFIFLVSVRCSDTERLSLYHYFVFFQFKLIQTLCLAETQPCHMTLALAYAS